MNRPAIPFLATALTTILALPLAAQTADATQSSPVRTKQVLSPTYTIDKKYRSMEGPMSMQNVYLGDPATPELVWITGVRTEMVGEDGTTAQLPELMCHVNVDLNPVKHQALFNLKRAVGTRLVTLSQGMLSAKLPEGFGYPVSSSEPLVLFTQVLNHNIDNPNNIKVRHRVTFDYIRDADLKKPLKPLFNVGASGSVLLADPNALPTGMSMPGSGDGHASHVAVDAGNAAGEGHANGGSCLLLPRAPNAAGTASDYKDPQGRKVTGHWVVPPGHQVNHSDITWFMALPYDTTLHYAAVHLHPFATSLTIRDTTENKTIFTANTKNPEKGVGLEHVDTFVSDKGVKLYRNHQYELISVYDNPTNENHDSMASVFMGVEDPEFQKPTPELLMTRAIDIDGARTDTTAVVRTTVGDFSIAFLPTTSPNGVKEFLRLVRTKTFEHAIAAFNPAKPSVVEIKRTEDLTKPQMLAMRPFAPETATVHAPGLVSICPGDASFAVVIGRTDRDGRCSVFGHVGPGADVIRAIASRPADAPPVEITKIDIYETATDAIGVQLAPAKMSDTAAR